MEKQGLTPNPRFSVAQWWLEDRTEDCADYSYGTVTLRRAKVRGPGEGMATLT